MFDDSLHSHASRSRGRSPLILGLLGLTAALLSGLVLGRLIFGGSADHEVSWLYSQTAESGELTDQGDGTYLLTLRDVDRHTIMFADRPDRLVEVIDTSALIADWDVLFASSSPNAVLVEHEPNGETDSIVMVLEQPTFDASAAELSYVVTILADEAHPERLQSLGTPHAEPPLIMKSVSLFIDSVTDVPESMDIEEGAETPETAEVPETVETVETPETTESAETTDSTLVEEQPAEESEDSNPSEASILRGEFADLLTTRLGLPSLPTEPVDLGGGVRLLSAETTQDANGELAARAVVGFRDDSFVMDVDLTISDPANWTLVAVAGTTAPWTPSAAPGLVIDPSTFTGSITSAGGSVTYDVRSGTHSWQIANDATYVSTLSLTTACPLEGRKCPADVTGPFVAMDGALSLAGIPQPIEMIGAMSTNADWARFDGTAGDVTLAGTGVTDATLTMWRGVRTDAFDAAMVLPDLGSLTGGTDLEFCGGFTLDIPKIGNRSTNGCVRWAPTGIVVGQIEVGGRLDGTLPTNGVSGAASADVAGAVYTTLSDSDLARLPSSEAVMSGVTVALSPETVVLAGKANLPGVVADALNVSLDVAALSVDVRGEVDSDGFSLSGSIKTAITIGSEPFKITIDEMLLTVSAESSTGATFEIGTNGEALVGYAPDTRMLQTSMRLEAATAPRIGMTLSVNARGTAASVDAGRDGLTKATRLTAPAAAQYVWPNQFGITGLNLWNLTVQIAFVEGSPALGYTSTSYVDPQGAKTSTVLKCTGTCDADDWMIGNLAFDISYANPCFAYSFESSSGTSGFVIDGGVLMATTFKIGMAPNGCSIQSGDVQQKLPVAFAGFQFSAEFGDAPRTTLNVATKTSVEGFVFDAEITNLKLAGITYSDIALRVEITDTSSEFSFMADMKSGMGDMSVDVEFAVNSKGIQQSLDAELQDWKWGKSGTVDLESFVFSTSTTIPAQGGCATFDSKASGDLSVGSRELELVDAHININCHGVQDLYLKVLYEHKVRWNGVMAASHLEIEYPCFDNSTRYLCGDVGFSYTRHFSERYDGRTFSRDVSVAFSMNVIIDKQNPALSGFSFEGDFQADRVSGAIGCSMDPGAADFTCGGRLRLNPSWAGIYHFDWGEM